MQDQGGLFETVMIRGPQHLKIKARHTVWAYN